MAKGATTAALPAGAPLFQCIRPTLPPPELEKFPSLDLPPAVDASEFLAMLDQGALDTPEEARIAAAEGAPCLSTLMEGLSLSPAITAALRAPASLKRKAGVPVESTRGRTPPKVSRLLPQIPPLDVIESIPLLELPEAEVSEDEFSDDGIFSGLTPLDGLKHRMSGSTGAWSQAEFSDDGIFSGLTPLDGLKHRMSGSTGTWSQASALACSDSEEEGFAPAMSAWLAAADANATVEAAGEFELAFAGDFRFDEEEGCAITAGSRVQKTVSFDDMSYGKTSCDKMSTSRMSVCSTVAPTPSGSLSMEHSSVLSMGGRLSVTDWPELGF
jgi:hypothetical protein